MTQQEVDYLLRLRKYKKNDEITELPYSSGEKVIVPLVSDDQRESFDLIVRCGKIELQKYHFVNRANKYICLVRLDLEPSVHINPDGQKIDGPHMHIYTAEYGERMAMPLPTDLDCTNLQNVITFFMNRCNIVTPPNIRITGLFQ